MFKIGKNTQLIKRGMREEEEEGDSHSHLPEGRARRRPRVMSLRAVGILVYKETIEH